jgi:hypothetical protein
MLKDRLFRNIMWQVNHTVNGILVARKEGT